MKHVSILFLVIISISCAFAQIRLPQLDVELKGGYAKIDAGQSELADDADYQMVAGGLHVQINQRIAVGGFYSKGVGGKISYGSGASSEYPLTNLMYGIDVKFSAGREPKWRPYIGLVYGKAEFVQDNNSFKLAGTTTIMGVDAGLMLRLGRSFYWKVIEISPRYLADKIWWIESDLCIEGKTGILYNIRLKSK